MVTVTLRPWSPDDLPLLVSANTPAMTEHLGGPETPEQVLARHENYQRFWREGSARMFAVLADGEPAGGIGWWSTEWRGSPVHETGWFVLPGAQGRGIARSAVALAVDDAVEHGTARLLTAYPAVANDASNAVCDAGGFERVATESFPFRGTTLTVNVWTLDLEGRRQPSGW